MSAPIPGSYSDIGKSASDLLGKDYPVAVFKLETKNTAPNGVSFILSGQKNTKSGDINGEFKSKYHYPKKGITLTETWTTNNHLTAQVELENSLAKGLKLDMTTYFQPLTGTKNIKGGLIFKQPGFHTKLYVDVLKGPTFQGDAVIGHEGFLMGGEACYDVTDGKVTRYGVSAGYTAPEYNVTLKATDSMSAYTLLYYHRVHPDIEAGAKAHWNTASNNDSVNMEIGAKYFLDRDAFVKAKIDNNGRLGLGYTQALRPGVKISLGGSIDTSKLGENNHKFGVSLNLES
ncbi:eukaryotic porin/Tom40 [Gigaspora rosea]|uniref:Eukaryotic porin/Tom40 n=1 Tax=Gigaspora rosea TaxID=44941 RepID=A0A397UJU8_9GLOM|nr:eukaryotic porin/Tom40 [Gigaspora rosea]